MAERWEYARLSYEDGMGKPRLVEFSHQDPWDRIASGSFFATLKRLACRPEAHARFVNTLSLLEYIGARKIMKSQKESRITAALRG